MVIELNRFEFNLDGIDSLETGVLSVTNTTGADYEFDYVREKFLIKKGDTKTFPAKVGVCAARGIAERKLALENKSFVHFDFKKYFNECIGDKKVNIKGADYSELKEIAKEKGIEITEENGKMKRKEKLIQELEDSE